MKLLVRHGIWCKWKETKRKQMWSLLRRRTMQLEWITLCRRSIHCVLILCGPSVNCAVNKVKYQLRVLIVMAISKFIQPDCYCSSQIHVRSFSALDATCLRLVYSNINTTIVEFMGAEVCSRAKMEILYCHMRCIAAKSSRHGFSIGQTHSAAVAAAATHAIPCCFVFLLLHFHYSLHAKVNMKFNFDFAASRYKIAIRKMYTIWKR